MSISNNFRLPSFLLLIVLTIGACSIRQSGGGPKELSGYDRVMQTGVIRCGYLLYPPYCMKDPNTGKLTGIFVEVMEKVGKKLNLKVDWSSEVGYESIFEGLRANRYDMLGSGLWPNASRSKAGDFSIPIFYSAVKAWGRIDDSRFNNNLSAINNPAITVAVIDGAMEDSIAKTDFPLAKRLSLPELSPHLQNMLNVATKKADVTFAEAGLVTIFLKSNPGTLKELAPNQPLRIFGNTFVFKIGDLELKSMINTVLEELLNSGEIDPLMKKYEPAPGIFRPVALPYRLTLSERIEHEI